jgi:amino acid transporter
MKFKKTAFVFLIVLLATTALYTPGWSQEDFTDYGDQIYDLLCLRPAAFLGGIGGTAVFVIALPYTVASGGIKSSFNMFVSKPFWYAFVRKFPDKKAAY